MPNSYFQFKQFRIDQGDCAMKVTTEGCLFGGAVKPEHSPKRILDIGTGTGLLALMLAQRFPDAQIDAVEIDEKAFQQAEINFKSSPWAERLAVSHVSIQNFQSHKPYDLIISNPPFFNSSQKAASDQANLARHEQSLDQTTLLDAIIHQLSHDGEFWILYPEREGVQFQNLASQKGFSLRNQITVRNRPGKAIFRMIQSFNTYSHCTNHEDIVIRDENGEYSESFQDLIKDFYL